MLHRWWWDAALGLHAAPLAAHRGVGGKKAVTHCVTRRSEASGCSASAEVVRRRQSVTVTVASTQPWSATEEVEGRRGGW